MVHVQDHIRHPAVTLYLNMQLFLALPLVILEMFQIFMLIKRSLYAIATSFWQTGFCIQRNTWQWNSWFFTSDYDFVNLLQK